MRVLIISLDQSILDPASEARSRMLEYAALADGLYVFVFAKRGSTRGSSRADLHADQNLFIYRFSASTVGWIKALFFGRRLVREKQIDVVSSQDPFETGLLGYLIVKLMHFHTIKYESASTVGLNVQLHGDFYGNPYWRIEQLLNRLRWHLGLFVMRRAGSIRVVSERIKQSLEARIKNQELRIIKAPIYTDIEFFRTAKPIFNLKEKYPQFNFIIITVANLVPVKNLEFLINAMKKLHEILTNAGLVIVGDGPLHKKLKAKSYKLQANNYIIFEGTQKGLVSYYKGADCLALVSKYEGWGRVVVEAVASGLPIVMSDVGLAGELIRDEESGLVVLKRNFDQWKFRFDQNAEDDLVRALSQVYFNENLRKKLIAGATNALQQLPLKQETLELIKKSWELATRKSNGIHD